MAKVWQKTISERGFINKKAAVFDCLETVGDS